MGVYIKNMTLEEFSNYGDYCQTLIGIGQADEIPSHGRLIDIDMLEKEICQGCKYENNKYSNCIGCAIARAPIIINAEK